MGDEKVLEFPCSSNAQFFDDASKGLIELAESLVLLVDENGYPTKWGPPLKKRPALIPLNFNKWDLGTISFYGRDFDSLKEPNYLNDNIVDFFMRW